MKFKKKFQCQLKNCIGVKWYRSMNCKWVHLSLKRKCIDQVIINRSINQTINNKDSTRISLNSSENNKLGMSKSMKLYDYASYCKKYVFNKLLDQERFVENRISHIRWYVSVPKVLTKHPITYVLHVAWSLLKIHIVMTCNM